MLVAILLGAAWWATRDIASPGAVAVWVLVPVVFVVGLVFVGLSVRLEQPASRVVVRRLAGQHRRRRGRRRQRLLPARGRRQRRPALTGGTYAAAFSDRRAVRATMEYIADVRFARERAENQPAFL